MIIGGYESCSLCDYPGCIASVIFTQGCNFDCPFCHNRQLIPLQAAVKPFDIDNVMDHLHRRKGKLDAVVISGGEPTIHEDLADLASEIKRLGFLVKLDTNGSRPDVLGDLISRKLIDFIAMDVKAPWNKYKALAGLYVDIEVIKESMTRIETSRLPHVFRTTYVPWLMNMEDIRLIAEVLPLGSMYITQEYREPRASVLESLG